MWLSMEKSIDFLEQITSGTWWQAALRIMGAQLTTLVNVTAGTAKVVSKIYKYNEEKGGDSK